MRPGEEYAARMLYEFVRCQGVDCAYTPGPDPPDYVFKVDGARWAVEVTELHDYVDAGSSQSVLGLEAGLQRILDDIDRETAASRKREYTVVLKGPLRPQNVAPIKREAIAHIRENRAGQLKCGENEECEIFPEEGPGPRLNLVPFVDGRARLPGSTGLHADIQATVVYTVSRIVEAKVPKLLSLSGFDELVLCILSQYFFADDENVRSALSKHEDKLCGINKVFLILGGNVLHMAPEAPH